MDPAVLIQTTLSGLGLLSAATNSMNATSSAANSTAPANGQGLFDAPFSISTILSLLLSFSALRDWLKLIVIGGAIETCRRSCMRLWSSVIESFWITASFDEHDQSYSA